MGVACVVLLCTVGLLCSLLACCQSSFLLHAARALCGPMYASTRCIARCWCTSRLLQQHSTTVGSGFGRTCLLNRTLCLLLTVRMPPRHWGMGYGLVHVPADACGPVKCMQGNKNFAIPSAPPNCPWCWRHTSAFGSTCNCAVVVMMVVAVAVAPAAAQVYRR